jgi:DNA replication protein DnaC
VCSSDLVPDLLDHLRATFAPTSDVQYDEQFERVRTAPLLILDDLGTESSTPWAQEKLFQILNHRYNARLPTVITSNRQLETIDGRLRSRMVDPDLSIVMTITAPDFRGGGDTLAPAALLSSLHLHEDQTFDTFNVDRPGLSEADRDNLHRALKLAREYAEDPRLWLALSGPYGCGKTHLAAAIANHRLQQGEPVLFVVVPDLLDHLRATFNPQSPTTYDRRFEEVRRTPLLILDDLGTESATAWAKEKLFQIFNYRYTARLVTVITTTDTPDDVDPRLMTRMADDLRCTFFVITAPGYRGAREPGAAKPRRTTRGRRSPV